MGKRTWIDSDLWIDTEDLSVKERLFYLYLLTNSQRNIAGYYKVSIEHTALDMQMTKDEVLEMLTKKQKYWAYDEKTGQVLIPRFTKYNTVKSDTQIRKLNAELKQLRPCPLHKEFLEAFEYCTGLGATELIDTVFRDKTKSFI